MEDKTVAIAIYVESMCLATVNCVARMKEQRLEHSKDESSYHGDGQ